MELNSKDFIILSLSLVGSALLAIFLESRGYFSKGFGTNDFVIIMIISVIAILGIIYVKLKEVNNDLKRQDDKLNGFSESLKRFGDLVNIKADIKYLKKEIKNGKN